MHQKPTFSRRSSRSCSLPRRRPQCPASRDRPPSLASEAPSSISALSARRRCRCPGTTACSEHPASWACASDPPIWQVRVAGYRVQPGPAGSHYAGLIGEVFYTHGAEPPGNPLRRAVRSASSCCCRPGSRQPTRSEPGVLLRGIRYQQPPVRPRQRRLWLSLTCAQGGGARCARGGPVAHGGLGQGFWLELLVPLRATQVQFGDKNITWRVNRISAWSAIEGAVARQWRRDLPRSMEELARCSTSAASAPTLIRC